MCGTAAIWTIVFMAAVMPGPAAPAGSASELLEKGIYTEETVGDLDRAISIYEKVIAEAKATRRLAAEAQFHIGQCLLKKGKKADAQAAFEKLIRDYPEAKELVAKARQVVPSGLPLGPVPWVDGETLQFRMRLATSMDLGTVVYFAHSAELRGQKIWRVGSRTLVVVSNVRGASSVDAEWNTFHPISSDYKLSVMGEFRAQYTPGAVVIDLVSNGKSTTRKLDLSEVLYDNEQAMHAMRRLPLAVGYKTTLPVLATMGGGEVKIPLEVQAKETVQVPAGRFECFRVHLGLVNQSFWFSADPHRYLVKFEANAVDAQLTEIGLLKPGQLRRYADDTLGFSLTAPNDWFFYARKPENVFLLDPQAAAMTSVTATKLADLGVKDRESPRAWAESRAAEAGKSRTEFKVQPQSWQQRSVAGLPAASCLADYRDNKRKMVDYRLCVLGKSLALEFSARLPADQLPSFRPMLDRIVGSLQVH
jgi:hypothetical protein